MTLRNALSASWKKGTLPETLAELSPADLVFLASDWHIWARDDQLPPQQTEDDPWRVWLVLGGRGAGKTRAGAEWIRAKALGLAPFNGEPSARIALVGETIGDVRHVMIEGISGLLAIHSNDERPRFEPSKMQLTWPNGAIAQVFGGDNPESLRGPQFDTGWVDELAKWREPERGWDMLQFGLRLGTHPQMVVTTTPKALPLLKTVMSDPSTVVTRSKTIDNAANLAPTFIREITRRYKDTALARQELDGEIIDMRAGSLWRRDWIDAHRLTACPELRSIVVAVDPPVTATASSDACGIMVVGLGPDNRAYVISDRTVQGREPHVWARAAVSAYQEFEADRIVAEINQGGDLVVSVLRQIDPGVAVQKVRATRGKWLRAEPVAALYAEGRVSHVGLYPQLEDQMCAFGADGLASGRSPDRLDALVWALTSLLLNSKGDPTIRSL